MRAGVDELIQIQDRFYILASSSRIDDRTRVLKHDETFAVLDRWGEIAPQGFGELGLYHGGTRFLSRLAITIEQHRPLLLGSFVTRDNSRLVVDLTNPDLPNTEAGVIPRGTLHMSREVLLWQGVCYDRLRLVNHGRSPVAITLTVELDADFVDIFEVRGMRRERSGLRHPVSRDNGGLSLAYDGLDGVQRTLLVGWSESPSAVSGAEASYALELPPHRPWVMVTTYACEVGPGPPHTFTFEETLAVKREAMSLERRGDCEIVTSNAAFNEWIERSIADLHMMITNTPQGPYPYAGVPWFSAPFGRDGLLTALEVLWVDPSVARGVLCFLAAHQAHTLDENKDAQPGKILHEARAGEMAALGEVPFGRYYGSVDATPLFVLLAGAYYERTGDRELLERLWPNLRLALRWMETDGDPDQDGFIEYSRRSPKGLIQQGWKDSFDSVFHENGEIAEGPIALCEVQGYAYAALLAAARLAKALPADEDPSALQERAARLRERFEEHFWCEDLSTYALALDGSKRPCRIRTSNAGHCLFSGIVREDRAARVTQTLLAEEGFSGWGIRTLSTREARYNPMSYHNGSVWPHDNALIAAGFSRYGFHEAAARVLTALFEASLHFDLRRTPELFCGFPRAWDAGPTLYPVACAPQAWSAVAPFMLLQGCLGLKIDASRCRVTLTRPALPEVLDEVYVKNLRVGPGCADLRLDRNGPRVDVSVLRLEGSLEVLVR